MLQLLLLIIWLVFGTMTVSALLYKNYHDHQILGVTLSREHEKSPEVQGILRRFQIECYLVLLLSIGLSFLMRVRAIQPYAEFCMLVLIVANLSVNWRVIRRYQKKLISIKQKNAWIYQRTRVVTVDMNVSKEKGKSGISPVWTWLLFILSFIPAAFLIFHKEMRASYPIGFSLIGPLCQFSMVFLYYQMRNRHSPALSDDTEINKACARTEERINTTSATLSALIMLIFWILFNISMIYIRTSLFIVLPLAVLLTGLLAIAYWQQRKIRHAENSFFGEVLKDDDIFEQESTWKWGCYWNPDDPRIFVPKRIAGMGWTINIGTPAGKAIGLGFIGLLIVVFGIVFYGGFKDYSITENGSEIIIDAAMYDMNIERDRVVSVSVIDKIPGGIRTNGYGGLNKSFGHLSIDGYGNCMLYIYNHIDGYIVLKLKGDDPGYVIVNGKSPEQTEKMYQEIRQWLEE